MLPLMFLVAVFGSTLKESINELRGLVDSWNEQCSCELVAFERYSISSPVSTTAVLASIANSSEVNNVGSDELLAARSQLLDAIAECRPVMNHVLSALCDLKFALEPHMQTLETDPVEIIDLDDRQTIQSTHGDRVQSPYSGSQLS